MRKRSIARWIATCVSPALLSGTVAMPLPASPVSTTEEARTAGYDGAHEKGAWAATNFKAGDTPAEGRTIVVSGYHPDEGFADELAAEASERAKNEPSAAR